MTTKGDESAPSRLLVGLHIPHQRQTFADHLGWSRPDGTSHQLLALACHPLRSPQTSSSRSFHRIPSHRCLLDSYQQRYAPLSAHHLALTPYPVLIPVPSPPIMFTFQSITPSIYSGDRAMIAYLEVVAAFERHVHASYVLTCPITFLGYSTPAVNRLFLDPRPGSCEGAAALKALVSIVRLEDRLGPRDLRFDISVLGRGMCGTVTLESMPAPVGGSEEKWHVRQVKMLLW